MGKDTYNRTDMPHGEILTNVESQDDFLEHFVCILYENLEALSDGYHHFQPLPIIHML